jgi:hypothetical protein
MQIKKFLQVINSVSCENSTRKTLLRRPVENRTLCVLDHEKQNHDVVVVRRTINLGYWEFGMRRERGGVEEGEVSL